MIKCSVATVIVQEAGCRSDPTSRRQREGVRSGVAVNVKTVRNDEHKFTSKSLQIMQVWTSVIRCIFLQLQAKDYCDITAGSAKIKNWRPHQATECPSTVMLDEDNLSIKTKKEVLI